ncbi:MAG: hypothetical protein GXO56_01970 [Chloroflexi bacterium]|nr:hypothetical protein [Chloroflexota bacterium]
MRNLRLPFLLALALLILACGQGTPASTLYPTAFASPPNPSTAASRPLMGFFPTPAEVSVASIIQTIHNMSAHADVVLIQQPIPWEDFVASPEANSKALNDTHNLVDLAAQSGLSPIFVMDPLNGLDRREFQNVPASWGKPTFADPRIRAAFRNYAVRLARDFHPRYLGLASEINTYMATYPDDADNFLSLYRETYAAIKAESPDTQVFVTFQWDQLRFPLPSTDAAKTPSKAIHWEFIEAFEPELDLWVISSYPCFYFKTGDAIPPDYYTPLLTKTTKPLAIGEGGCPSTAPGSPASQSAYLETIHTQLGERLAFWIYLLYNDLDMDAYRKILHTQNRGDDVDTLSWFVHMGLADVHGNPKPSLATWDALRASNP